MVRHLPNLITCANLLCGCIGLVQVFQGQLVTASWLIILAAVFDFLDGFAARRLKAFSPIGKDLDSLADVVTFGVLPAAIIYHYLSETLTGSSETWVPYLAFSLAVFSALRLAVFNNDPRQSDVFIGLPTPANGLLIASFPLIFRQYPDIAVLPGDPAALWLVFVALMSWLLVAELPLIAFKFKTFDWKGNEVRYSLILVALVLLALLKIAAVPLIVLVYVLISWVVGLRKRKI